MKLSGIDCNMLKVESEDFTNLMLANLVNQITLTASINKGTEIVKTIPIDPEVRTYSVSLVGLNKTVTAIQIKNIITGVVTNLLDQPLLVDEDNVQTLATLVSGKLNAMGLSDFSQTITVDSTGCDQINTGGNTNMDSPNTSTIGLQCSFDYSIRFGATFPAFLVMTALTATNSVHNFSLTTMQENGETVAGAILTPDYILLYPEFFGEGQFSDSIIHVRADILKTDMTILTEEVCFFLDCNMRCSLPDILDIDCETNKDLHLAMLHYSLTQANNCQCDCDEMYSVFTFLQKQLSLTSNQKGCGC